MGAGILNLVANNGSQNRWINEDPQITFFKKIYRRHTPFAIEEIPISFSSKLCLGGSGNATLLPHGDLVHRIYFAFDVPKLAAYFPNSKSRDIYEVINKLTMFDQDFANSLKSFATHEDGVELDQIFKLVDDQLDHLDQEQQIRLDVNQELKDYQNTACTDNIKFKIELIDQWVNHKQDYFLINEILKLIYFSEKNIINVPLVDARLVPKKLIENHIFHDLIPNRAIFSSFLLKNNQAINEQFPKNIFSQDVEDNFCDFGPHFYYLLNFYNSVIGVVNSLATTVPIVIAKAYGIEDNIAYNIYQSMCPVTLRQNYFPTIIDPNFRANFMIRINNLDKPVENNIFVPIDIIDANDKIYPDHHTNSYLSLFNTEANNMFNRINKSMDIIFETYRSKLFCSTDKLFFNNSAPLSNIYCYIAPTNKFQDDACLKISNVFNANIWFFYFFKYLDMLNVVSFARYTKKNIMPEISDNSMVYMKNLIVLLKINIEYYMNEISYLLNDLYANSPSTNPCDNMKNYVPSAHNTTINGTNTCNDFVAITLIFHRNHVPTILEIFQFIYHFIDTIDAARMSQYLEREISEPNGKEILKIKSIIKLFYYQIFSHFMNVYDNFHFEPPANFSTQEFGNHENNVIKKYVYYFLNNTCFWGSEKYEQITLTNVLGQMEFYFVAEMIHMREIQKLYHNILFNRELISTSIGDTNNLIDFIHRVFSQTHRPELESGARKFWDELYSPKNNFYYGTFNIDRYCGKAYLNTGYLSRNYGLIDKPVPPFPLPRSNPYGINSDYYNHAQVVTDYVPFPTTNSTILENNIPVYWTPKNCQMTSSSSTKDPDQNGFQLFPIDYFRIKHEIFMDDNFDIPSTVKFVDHYQFNILRLLKLTTRIQIHSYNEYLFKWLHDTIYFLVKYTYPLELSKILGEYLFNIETSINKGKNMMTPDYLSFITTFSNEMFDRFNYGEELTFDQQCPYTASDLLSCNNYVDEIMRDSSATHIIGKLRVLRDSYITQYFYYAKYQKSISQIFNLQEISNSFIFQNLAQISRDILDHININNVDLSILAKNFYHPDMYPNDVSSLLDIKNSLDDFSQYIFEHFCYILDPRSSIRLTFRDVIDLINDLFMSIKQIYQYAIENNIFDDITNKLSIYQPILLVKLELFHKISDYLMNTHCLTNDDIFRIANMVGKYQLDFDEYFEYISREIMPIYHLNNRVYIINLINNDLDKRFLQKFFPKTPYSIFKTCILDDLFSDLSHGPGEKHPLRLYFSMIDNQYYSLIYFFMMYAKQNNLEPLMLHNPLTDYPEINLVEDQNDIIEQYESFTNIENVLVYLMDYVCDCAMSMNHRPNSDHDLLGYSKRFSLIGNVLTPQLRIELSQEIAQKGIVVIAKMKSEILLFKNKLLNILYRNKTAKTAWIRKLGHFIIKEVTIKFSDQIYDHHVSDWFEIFHEISQNANSEIGYNKMIGHRKDLITFDDKPKNSYTIYVPFVFCFNKNSALSIPLNASINTKFQIDIKLRSLEEICYKEEFSHFIDPGLNQPYVPNINNAHLIVEYIYLSSEERKIFISKPLEFLIEELQYDVRMVSDNKLLPIYRVGNIKKNIVRTENGKKIKEECYNEYKGIDVEQVNPDSEMIPRNDYHLSPHVNRNGITKMMMVKNPINVDPLVHKKRIIVENKFNHPTKFMAVIFKPIIHTDPNRRCNELNYFYGERQWDNYGLHSYYDLSKIAKAKLEHYQIIKKKINDLEDETFGFINIINQLLVQYVDKPCEASTNEKWIIENHEHFLETLQKIKEAYMFHYDTIIYGNNSIRLKENILALSIDYPISNIHDVYSLVKELANSLNISSVTMDAETIFSIDENHFSLSKTQFVQEIKKIYDPSDQLINYIYQSHNERQINILIREINKLLNINDFTYNFVHLITYFYHFYLLGPMTDSSIINNIGLIYKKIGRYPIRSKNRIFSQTLLPGQTEARDGSQRVSITSNGGNKFDTNIKNLTYRDVIHQIIPVQSNYSVAVVASKMVQKLNELVDNYYVEIIDYPSNMIPNSAINPLLDGYLKFNDISIMPENTTNVMWSEQQAYKYFHHTPSTGINLHSWSLNPLIDANSIQSFGSVNLSKIDNFASVYNLHPLISDSYPVSIVTMVLSVNIIRYLAGMCGKAW